MSNSIFICGGGTGGHFFSGMALAEKYLQVFPDRQIVFIGTRYGIEARTPLPDARMQIRFIHAKGLKGKGLLSKILGAFFLAAGVFESVLLILKHRPRVVWGVGGYASAPTVAAAVLLKPLLGLKVGVLEQNSLPGMVNRLFSRFPVLALSGFEYPNFQVVDLPLRAHVEERAAQVKPAAWPPQNIFILGGSQGAAGINKAWCELLPELKKKMPSVHVFHQTGAKDKDAVEKAYQSAGISAEVFAFSTDMPLFYEKTDLMVCRSGALTVFEVMAFQRPCVFVPFPKAADDHQRKNALAVQVSDWIIDEKDLNWARLKVLLESQKPAIPKRKTSAHVEWGDILRLMS